MHDPTLPRIDLHRHLDGNVRLQTILDLAREHTIALPGDTIETLRPHVQVMDVMPDLVTWLNKLSTMTGVLADLEACRRIARENVEDAALDGLDYVELRFSPYFMALPHNLDPRAVTEAVVAGVAEGRAANPIDVNLIGILSRTYGPEACTIELNALLAHRDHLRGIDLAGDEISWPAEVFTTHFRRARDAGLAITVHAGEAGDARSVWSAIEVLGAQRIGHGTRSIDDPALMDYLAEHRIGIESNLTSNVQTNTVPSYADHPLKRFLDHGILATINTDDPVISGITWQHEIDVAAPSAGLSRDDIALAQRNALEVAFLTPEERAALQSRVSDRLSP